MKVLILGSTGMLGQSLVKESENRNIKCIGLARSNADCCVDITDDKALLELVRTQSPDVLINTCAIVNHKICDEDTKLAYETNGRVSSILTNLAKELKFKYIYISTDGYFNGDGRTKHTENAPITLMNEYARTKFVGEMFTLTNPNALVLRTNIVGFRGKKDQPTFVEWVINALKNEEEMTLFEDYYTSSISVTQFSKSLFDLLPENPSGVLNLASSEISSKKEFIETLAKEFEFSLKNTKTGTVSSLTTSKRADSLGLDVSKAELILGYKLPTLIEVIAQLKKEYNNVR